MTDSNPKATLLLWTLFVGLVAALVLLRPWDVAPPPWDYSELAPIEDASTGDGPRQATDIDASAAGHELDATAAALQLELRLTPRAGLIEDEAVYGSETLAVRSFASLQEGGQVIRRGLPCRVQAIAGVPGTYERWVDGDTKCTGLPRGRMLLRFEREGGLVTERLLRLPRREPVDIDWAVSGKVRGRVLGDQGEELGQGALAGVEVAGRSVACAPDGSFEVAGLVAGSSVPIVVRAKGRALQIEAIEVAPAPMELRFYLARAWRLRMTAPELQPSALAVVPASREDRVFPYHALRFVSMGRGRFEVDGLPLGQDVGIAALGALRVSAAATTVRAPATARIVEAVIASRAPEAVRGVVNLRPEPDSSKRRDPAPLRVRLLAVDASRPPWGASLFGSEALIPAAWARLGAAFVEVAPGSSYELAMPGRRTRLSAEASGYTGQTRVLQRASRLRADFGLEAAAEAALAVEAPTDTRTAPYVLRLGFEALPARVPYVEVQVFWNGEPRGKKLRFDPRRTIDVPLGGAVLLDAVLRRPGSRTPLAEKTLRVVHHAKIIVPFPST